MNNDAVLLMSDDGVNFGEPIAVMVKDAMIHVFGQREKILGWAAHVHRSYQTFIIRKNFSYQSFSF